MRAAAALAAVALAVAASAQDGPPVDVQLDLFGAGSSYRPGDPVGIRLELTSSLDEPTPVVVQWEVPNAEGDIAELSRSATLTPGVPTLVWVYGELPSNAQPSSVWSVRVFEERNGRRRRELGAGRIAPTGATYVPDYVGLIGVVGSGSMGLVDYGSPGGAWSRPHPPGANESTQVVGLTPKELPDRWFGLAQFEAIAWGAALPQELGLDAADSLREYVRRGGHLIIDLPLAGNPWGLGTVGQTYFDDLLPTSAPRNDEGVKLSDLMPVLSKTDVPLRDVELSIRVFGELGGDFDAIDNAWEPLVALPDGRVVVIQRTYGFGRLTMIGIDLSNQLTAMGLPEADAFWNRILGRRGDTPGPAELNAMQDTEPSRLARPPTRELAIGTGEVLKDDLNLGTRAQVGTLLALFIFAAYLLAAGPGGFYLLKHKGWLQHSWVAFAGTAAVFTAIAWGGVRVMRQHGVQLRHVTFLDHVAPAPGERSLAEPRLQRAVSWMSLYLPSYGEARVSIESDPDMHDLLVSWSAPGEPPQRFPNVARYPIDVGRQPADYSVPVRATATQLYARWMGALDPEWGGLIRVNPEDPIRIERGPDGKERLAGSLLHDLPGDLTDVIAIWVGNPRGGRLRNARDEKGDELPWTSVPPPDGRDLLNQGRTWKKAGTWPAGEAYAPAEKDEPGMKPDLRRNIYRLYIEKEEASNFGQLSPKLDQKRRRTYMEMLSIYQQLTPPKYHRDRDKEPDTIPVNRRLGRELDLSTWFSRPCLIVIGFLDGARTPIPFRVDGRPPAADDGLVVVRWVLPLPLDEREIAAKGPAARPKL